MDITKFQTFLDCQASGRKEAARIAVREFIDSFSDEAEIEDWVWEYLPQMRMNGASKIRHELFEELIYPVLRDGYEAEDFESTLWLGKLILNVYAVTSFHDELHQTSDRELFERCYSLKPESEQARALLLDAILRGLDHANHEWPAGLLHGMDGANLDQCRELRAEIALARKLMPSSLQSNFLDSVENNLTEYESRLAGLSR